MTEPDDRPTVAILLTPQMRAQLIPPAAETRLAEAARVVAPGEGELSAEALGRLVAGAGAAITGWGRRASTRRCSTAAPTSASSPMPPAASASSCRSRRSRAVASR